MEKQIITTTTTIVTTTIQHGVNDKPVEKPEQSKPRGVWPFF